MNNDTDAADPIRPGPGRAGVESPTAELRRDVVSGNSVLVNPARSGRPFTVSRRDSERSDVSLDEDLAALDDCPFCWGNEHATSEELARVGRGAAGEPGWQVRVVRNRYPVVGGPDPESGRCEVIVFREHMRRLEDLDTDALTEIAGVIRDRVAVHTGVGRDRADAASPPGEAREPCNRADAASPPGEAREPSAMVQVFVNTDWESGASIAHPHAQLIALDFVPPALDLEFAVIERSIADGHGPDPLRHDLDLAVARDLMVVDDDVAAWCPWEMPNPFGVRIAPKVQLSPFAALEAGELSAFARTLGKVLRSVNVVLERPAYNVVFFGDQERGDLVRRWRVEVIPRINVPGGFEIGTGVTTHSTDTVGAARALRLRAGAPGDQASPTLTRHAL